jgi:hypothetical protein
LRPASAAPDFARDVRPILEKSCFGCHGPDKQKSGYRLDRRDTALKGGDSGNRAIVPHDSKNSPLIRYVSGEDPETVMPPAKSTVSRLTPEQVTILREWIDAGPAWPDELAGAKDSGKPHWSLLPLVSPTVPGTGANPIDAFVHAKLTEHHLGPSPQADRRTLIRRLYYDLTGLPPSSQEVDAFVADTDSKAFEKLVDRLLASPRYGEHWARHWLDVAHYADTHGNDHDHARPNAWPYRDYVIRSLNADKPYSRFVQEQVAGDALFPDDPEATRALGFLAAGPWDDTLMVTVREDTVDHRMAEVLDRDDMVSTVIGTFQSATIHCARCHNHKFDPISQREYYSLQAVFAGVGRADRPVDEEGTLRAKRKELLARKSAIERGDTALLDSQETQAKVEAAAAALARRGSAWKTLDIVNIVSAGGVDGTVFTRQPDGSWFVSGTRPAQDTFIVMAHTNVTGIRALRLEALPDDRLPGKGPGRYEPSGNFHLTEFRALARPAGSDSHGGGRLEFVRASADRSDAGDVVANAIDSRDKTFWSVHPHYGRAHEAVFELKEPAGFERGTDFVIRLEQNGTTGHQLGRFRLSFCTEPVSDDLRPPAFGAETDLLRISAAQRTPEQQRKVAQAVLAREVDSELAALPPPKMVYAVAKDFPPNGSFKPIPAPRPIHVLTRGDINNPGELVGPGALSYLPGLPGDFPAAGMEEESVRRAALARWLTDDRNALTWRSIVNRVWHYHFGRGLCDSPNDFGKMGGVPSHPELIDWLAVWFRDEAKGSVKALHRLILTSQTWRQSSVSTAGSAIDANNRLLWRMNRRRLTAEQLRDSVLSISGQIDLTMGGPSVVQFVSRGDATFKPPGGAPAFLDYVNFPPDDPANRRRAVYRFIFRTVADPLMDALDCPDGGAITAVRSQSTTALQAFALLNDAFLVRQCEHIATRCAREPAPQTTTLFRLMLQRDPSAEESAAFTACITRHGLANACQVLMNSNEFLHLD